MWAFQQHKHNGNGVSCLKKTGSGKKFCYQNMEGNQIKGRSILNINRGGRET